MHGMLCMLCSAGALRADVDYALPSFTRQTRVSLVLLTELKK